jgi:SAM-dependent methyltransferase
LTYDAILSFYTTFGYHCDTENAGVVKNMARSLRHGGIFIVEVFNKEYLGHQTPAVTEEVFGAISLRKLHRFDASSSRLVMDWTYFEAEKEIEKQNFSIRLYSFEEFTALFKAAGLKIRAVYSDTDQRPFDPEGKKLVLVGTPI